MPQNIFKIYDGRTNFWQWDRKQKLIVLDESVTEVHFSNRNMTHSIPRDVYAQGDLRVCNVPDDLLQMPRNLVVHAYANGATIKTVKFAVMQRPMPNDYIADQGEEIDEKFAQIDVKLEALNETKADNIYYDEEGQYIQLVANGEPIGDRVEVLNNNASGIDNCEVNEEGHLIVTLTNGRIIDAGYVGSTDGVTFIPHISEDNILTWTNNGGLENPEPVDLNPFDEWVEIDDVESNSDYTWERL